MMDPEHDRFLKALAAAPSTGGTFSRQLPVLGNPGGLVYRSARDGMAGILYSELSK